MWCAPSLLGYPTYSDRGKIFFSPNCLVLVTCNSRCTALHVLKFEDEMKTGRERNGGMVENFSPLIYCVYTVDGDL